MPTRLIAKYPSNTDNEPNREVRIVSKFAWLAFHEKGNPLLHIVTLSSPVRSSLYAQLLE